ncbi:MAG: triose-phosphate isomerase [Candidatus Kaelpia aquatica]|nr:triose-phosphate isomerase [Candidatus Kaelpia aquatica]
MARDLIFAGNWKMNKTIKEALELVNGLKRELVDIEEAKIVVAPPSTALSCVGDTIVDSNIDLSAQNIHSEVSGAYTGEISVLMAKDAGCKYTIIGHSERRKYFKEDDALINKKIKLALENNLEVIFCVGESLEEREEGRMEEVVKTQLLGGLEGISKDDLARIVVAYEPVWAIGTGKNATPQEAQEVHALIREELVKKYDQEAADSTSILYGGSVKSDNIEDLMKKEDLDGVLVGGASLEIGDFSELVKKGLSAKQ